MGAQWGILQFGYFSAVTSMNSPGFGKRRLISQRGHTTRAIRSKSPRWRRPAAGESSVGRNDPEALDKC